MHIKAEITVNPSPKTVFLTELRIERWKHPAPGWWSLWLSFWVFKPKWWRDMLWDFTWVKNNNWVQREIRLLGFEITWQRRYR